LEYVVNAADDSEPVPNVR